MNTGDFKGDPEKLMQRYFDAHAYVANRDDGQAAGHCQKRRFQGRWWNAFTVSPSLEFKATKKIDCHLVSLRIRRLRSFRRRGRPQLDGANLSPIRDELLRGDFRSLYIGWLPAVFVKMLDYHDEETLALSGLGNLTTAQKGFGGVSGDRSGSAGRSRAWAAQRKRTQGIQEAEMEVWIKRVASGPCG
ncbi:MAG: hypothetical protein R2860_11705 [Desulfobacterales bacterium]